MPDLPLLRDLLVVMGASVVVVAVLHRRNIPAPLGYMLVGLLVGPASLGWVGNKHEVEMLAEVGVALLLFSIGLHFSLRDLLQMGRLVWGGGTAQVLLTLGTVALIARGFGLPTEQAILLGSLVTLSSTALVMRILQDLGTSASPSGRLMLGILLLQDLAIVPLMLLVPLLGSQQATGTGSLALVLLKAFGMIGVILLLGRFGFPWLLKRIVELRSPEVFTLTILVLALGTAELAHQAGLSLALGAFLAGIMLADTEYAAQILGEIAPFRDAFTGLFFVSVGMLLDPRVFLTNPLPLIAIALGIIALKALIIGGIAIVLGLGPRVALIAGLGLAQIGEFSFLLGQSGLHAGLLDQTQYGQFLAITILLMALAPFILQATPRLANRLLNGLPRRPADREEPAEDTEAALPAHVIVIGFGLNGRNVARVLRDMEVPLQIVELNPQLMRHAQQQDFPVLWGDATRRTVLEQAGIDRARAIVIAIADPSASRQITALAHELHPDMLVLVRTRYLAEMDELYRLGADEVVPEEIETSLELAARVMRAYGASEWSILRTQQELREDHYGFLLGPAGDRPARLSPLMRLLAQEAFEEVILGPEDFAVGRTLRELDLTGQIGVLVLATVAQSTGEATTPTPDTPLGAQDVLLLLGKSSALDRAQRYLTTGARP